MYPDIEVSYAFNNRSFKTHIYTIEAFNLLQTKVNQLDDLVMKSEEIEWYLLYRVLISRLKSNCAFFSPGFITYLKQFRFEAKKYVTLSFDKESHHLSITISGVWHQVILYEVPILALVTECFFKVVDTNWYIRPSYIHISRSMKGQEERAAFKCQTLIDNGVSFSDFGTRRRRDLVTHDLVVSAFKQIEVANKSKANPSLGSFMVSNLTNELIIGYKQSISRHEVRSEAARHCRA